MLKQPRLLDFIIDELRKGECLIWADKNSKNPLTFIISDSGEIASRWGRRKKNKNMTYEKFSRALRFVH